MFAHGYEGEGSGIGAARSEPLDAHLTRRGYAWAASGYRAWGYRPDWFLLDLLELRAYFIKRFGRPRWTIIHGQSMGGHISIASLEFVPRGVPGRADRVRQYRRRRPHRLASRLYRGRGILLRPAAPRHTAPGVRHPG